MSIEYLVSQVNEKLAKLQLLHNEIGTPPDKQLEQQQMLYETMLDAAEKHLDQITLERGKTEELILATHQRILLLKRLMGEVVVDNGFIRQPTLTVTLQDLDAKLRVVQKKYDQQLEGVVVLQKELIRYRECLQSFVNSYLIVEENPDVSMLAVAALKDEIKHCQEEYHKRARYLDNSAKEIVDMWVLLGLLPQNDRDNEIYQLYDPDITATEKQTLYSTLVTEDGMNYVNERIAELNNIRQEREFRKQEVMQRLHHLWERLKIPRHDRESFRRKHGTLKNEDIKEWEKEVARLNLLKGEHIEEFIQSARDDLVCLWDQLYFSSEERMEFKPAFSDDLTDTALELHENEISRLQFLLEDRKYILELVEKYKKLSEEIKEFEQTTNDPARLFGKGRRDPGRLLREERFRKRVAKEFPKAKNDLEHALMEYQTTTGKPFCVYGKPYLEEIKAADTRARLAAEAGPSDTDNNRTPRRRFQNDVDEDIYYRKAMTSPRFKSTGARRVFPTPQSLHVRDFGARIAQVVRSEQQAKNKQQRGVEEEQSVLHRVRENNIRKRKAAMVGCRPLSKQQQLRISGASSDHTFDSLFSDNNDENTVPSDMEEARPTAGPSKAHKAKPSRKTRSLLLIDDDAALDLDIFDDGPELSDLSADEL